MASRWHCQCLVLFFVLVLHHYYSYTKHDRIVLSQVQQYFFFFKTKIITVHYQDVQLKMTVR